MAKRFQPLERFRSNIGAVLFAIVAWRRGSGKAALLAFGLSAIQQGHRVLYREAHVLLDELADATGLPVREALGAMTRLEIAGLVEVLVDGKVARSVLADSHSR